MNAESQEVNKTPEQPIKAASGKPYTKEKGALSAMKQKGLSPDDYSVVEVEGGFVIKKNDGSRKVGPSTIKGGKYYWVRFHDKSNPNDSDDVNLSVNGETIICQRQKEVVLPERFLECADHATYPVYRQLPGKPRKVAGNVKVFPYDKLGEATEKEFKKQKRAGDRLTKQNIKKYGFDVDPEAID